MSEFYCINAKKLEDIKKQAGNVSREKIGKYLISVEVAYQLKRIADLLELSRKV